MYIWSVIQHGFFHNKHALHWAINDGTYPRCHIHIETTEHLFYACTIVQRRWKGILQLLQESSLCSLFRDTLFETIATTIKCNKRKLGVILIAEICRTFHDKWNKVFFGQDFSQIPNWCVLWNVVFKLTAMSDTTTAARKKWQINKDLQEIKELIDPWLKQAGKPDDDVDDNITGTS